MVGKSKVTDQGFKQFKKQIEGYSKSMSGAFLPSIFAIGGEEVHIQHRKYIRRYFENSNMGSVRQIRDWMTVNCMPDIVSEYNKKALTPMATGYDLSEEKTKTIIIEKYKSGNAINTSCSRMVKRGKLKSLSSNPAKKIIDRVYYV